MFSDVQWRFTPYKDGLCGRQESACRKANNPGGRRIRRTGQAPAGQEASNGLRQQAFASFPCTFTKLSPTSVRTSVRISAPAERDPILEESREDGEAEGLPLVRIQLLGAPRLWVGGGEESLHSKPAIGRLLVCLAFPLLRDSKGQFLPSASRRRTTRVELIQTIWPDEGLDPTLRNRFRRLLADAQDLLEADLLSKGEVLACDGQEIRMTSRVRTDLDPLPGLARQALLAPVPSQRLRAALSLMRLLRGELLAGMDAVWILTERTRLAELFSDVLAKCLDAAPVGDDADLVGQIGQAALLAWPSVVPPSYDRALIEESARQVMCLNLRARRSEAALAQYASVASVLLRSGRSPSDDLRHLEQEARSHTNAGTERLRRKPLVGRAAETSELARLLMDRPPLVTVTGAPGAGKTHLAEEVATEAAAIFGGRVFLVRLQAQFEGWRIPNAVLKALAVRRTSEEPMAQLIAELRPFPTLLLLDNFEHLLASGGADVVMRLIADAPLLTCLATSRERLRIEGEIEFPVAPLPVPGERDEMDSLPGCPSVELFMSLARVADPAFRLTPANAAPVRDLCRLLDGLPLAIGMATAWAKTLAPSDMLSRLREGVDKLVSCQTAVQDRHRSLHAAMEWSFSLLPPYACSLLVRMSVFRGGCSLGAAQALWGDQVLTPLRTLLDHSLLERDLAEGTETRYRMLETLRQFAQQKLEESGEADKAAREHLGYFRGLAEATDRHMQGKEQGEYLALLDREGDNLAAALAWCWGPEGDAEAGAHTALCLHQFWELRGHLREGRRHYARALAWEAITSRPALKAGLLIQEGTLAFRHGELQEARSYLLEALTLWREQDQEHEVANALLILGAVEKHLHLFEDARRHYEDGLAIFEREGDEDGTQRMLNNLAILLLDTGETEAALAMHERCLAVRRGREDKYGEAASLNNIAVIHARRMDYGLARVFFEESFAIRSELGNKQGMVTCLLNLAMLARCDKDHPRACSRLCACVKMAEELGDLDGISYALVVGMGVAQETGRERQAARLCGAVEALREEIGAPLPPTQWQEYTQERDDLAARMGGAAYAEEFAAGRLDGWESALWPILDAGA